MSDEPIIIGELSSHELAAELASVVHRVHLRYATEVVATNRLCPFLKDPATAFGRFVVVLSRELDVKLAADTVLASDVQVAHLVYPLTTATPTEWERFGNAVHREVASRGRGGPVHAAFHPEMVGDATTAAKLVGFMRRAPDPFIQFIPEGLHEGGSSYIDLEKVDLASLVDSMPHGAPPKQNAQSNFERLTADDIAHIRDTIEDIREDRNRSYAAFLQALGCG